MISAEGYTAQPMQLDVSTPAAMAQSAYKMQLLLRKAVRHGAFFSDLMGSCDCTTELCSLVAPGCIERRDSILRDLAAPDSLTWEVWTTADAAAAVAFVGILRLTRVRIGEDATAHYFFFDGKLQDKTALLQAWADWVFSDSATWTALHRITVEVPAYMSALAKHARKHLGLIDEGRRREACLYKGRRHDMLILGKLKEEHAIR